MFAQVMANRSAYTANGALSHSTTGNPCVDLFYASSRGIDATRLEDLVTNAFMYDPLITLKLIAYIRNCRGGKGERKIGRQLLNWLAINSEHNLKFNLDKYLNFGRFDDFIALLDTNAENYTIKYISTLLKEDLNQLNDNEPISLLAKWIPSEGKSVDRKTKVYSKIAKELGVSNANLRKLYLSPLRNKLNLLETQMCNEEWNDINFSRIPSNAMKIHGRKNNAFDKHCSDRFNEFKQQLKDGKTKINAKVMFPHEVVNQYCSNKHYEPDSLVEAQWQAQLDKCKEFNLDRCLVLSDVSGSMEHGKCSIAPMVVSLTFGLLVSQLTHDAFKNLVLTFEEMPRFHKLTGSTLYEQVRQLKSAPWGGSTDLQAAFDLILKRAITFNIPESEMPNRLIIVSDMQFNQADSKFMTNLETIKMKYKNNGYIMPKIVFLNCNGSTTDFPSNANENNVSLISGFSTDILKCILNDQPITPEITMMNAINDHIYDSIVYYDKPPAFSVSVNEDNCSIS